MKNSRFLLCVALLGMLCPSVLLAQRERLSPDDADLVDSTWPKAQKTSTSIRIVVEREGKGEPPRPGDMVSVFYVGRLLDGGTVFDRNDTSKRPFSFRVGRAVVIDGWDQVLLLMKPGEKALVVIPAELAYGWRGSPPKVPGNAALLFEIELVSVEREN